jgi:probable HAF family extracellular repeat protein
MRSASSSPCRASKVLHNFARASEAVGISPVRMRLWNESNGGFESALSRKTGNNMTEGMLVLSAAIAAALTSGASAAPAYTVTDLGTLGGAASVAHAINAAGEITGVADTASDTSVAFLYSHGQMKNLGTLGGSVGVGYAINATGQVAGYATNAQTYRPFLYNGRKMKDIGDLGGGTATAFAINRRGDVVGSSHTAGGNDDPFLYDSRTKTMVDLGNLGPVSPGEWNVASGINDAGQITGESWDDNAGGFFAFLWDHGKMTNLGTLGGPFSTGEAINKYGQITGQAYTTGGAQAHAFLWSKGHMKDLGVLPGGPGYSWGVGINSAATVVGYSQLNSGITYVDHAFVYSGKTMRDLNDLIPRSSGWLLNIAWGVNDSGAIVGEGTVGGKIHAFLLTPH